MKGERGAEGEQADPINPTVKAEQLLVRQVGIVFMRYTQPETRYTAILPDHIIHPFVRYVHTLYFSRQQTTSLIDMTLAFGYHIGTSDKEVDIDPRINEETSRVCNPLTKTDNYILFHLYRQTHPHQVSEYKLARLKARFYTDLVTNKLAQRWDPGVKDPDNVTPFEELLACDFLFVYGRQQMIKSGIFGDAQQVNGRDEIVSIHEKLQNRWQGFAADPKAHPHTRETSGAFVDLHTTALATRTQHLIFTSHL